MLALAAALADSIEWKGSTRWVFADIARAQAEFGDVDGALATVEKIGGFVRYPRIFDSILDAQLASGDIAAILTAASAIQDEWTRNPALLKIAVASADAGRADLARKALQAASETLATTESLEARLQAATSTAYAAAALGEQEIARHALDVALTTAELNVPTQHRTGAALTATLVRAAVGDVATARLAAETLRDPGLRGYALASLAAVRAQSGAYAEAMATARAIEDRAYYVAALTWIAHEQEAMGDHASARKALGMALRAAKQIEDPKARAGSLILVADPRSGPLRYHEAAIGLTLMLIENVDPRDTGADAENPAMATDSIDPAAAQDAVTAALQATRRIRDAGAHPWFLPQIADLQIGMGAYDEAWATANQIRDTSSVDLGWPQLTGKVAEIYLTDGFIARIGERDRTLTAVARAQGNAGSIDGMLRAAETIATPVIRVQLLTRLANDFLAKQELATARVLVRAALENNDKVESDVRRFQTLAEIAAVQAALGDGAAAVATARAIQNRNRRVEALAQVARAFTTAQTDAAARETDVFLRTLILAANAVRNFAAQDLTSTRTAIGEALRVSGAIDDDELRLAARTRIGEVQIAIGDVNGLRQTLALAAHIQRDTVRTVDSMQTFAAIAEAQANAGDFGAALASADALDDAELRARTLLSIAKAMPD